MANIAMILRTRVAINRFQAAIVNAVACPHFDRALLCSGFFQEGSGGYFASNTFLPGTSCMRRPTPMEMSVVGTYNLYGLPPFHAFVDNVRALTTCTCCLNISKRKTNRWHAKVFIAWESGVPAFAVIGSSNITRPAFDTTSPFNFESDVILWNTSCSNATALAERLFGDIKGTLDVLFANYEEKGRNGQMTLADKMTKLAEEIINSSNSIE